MGGSSFSSDQSVAHATATAQMVAIGGTGKTNRSRKKVVCHLEIKRIFVQQKVVQV